MEENSKLNEQSVVRYSLALYKIAKEQSIETELDSEITSIIEKYDSDKKFDNLFTNPLLSPKEQLDIVNAVFSNTKKNKIKISKVMFAFISLLANNNRLNILRSCLSKLQIMLLSHSKELNIKVTTVNDIDNNFKKQLTEIFSNSTQKKVSIYNIVDKDILGGMIIEMGSNLIDASIRNKISKINGAIKGVN